MVRRYGDKLRSLPCEDNCPKHDTGRCVPICVSRGRARDFDQPRRAALIAATSIFFMVIIASNARFASPPPTAIAALGKPADAVTR